MRHIQEIDMNELIVANVNKYAKMLAEKKYLQSGYIAVREEDGIVITNPRIDYTDVKEDNLTFVNDKNIETLEGNFRAAAVILFCAIRQDKEANAAAIVDSDSTVEFSKKRKTLMPILDDMAQVCGVSIKCAQKNVASDVVAALSGQRNCCLLPEAGAVVTGRTLDEVFTATLVLDKACNAEILAESKGGTQHMSAVAALLEHVVFKLKYSKTNQKQQKAAESGETEVKEEKQTAVVTDEEKKIAQDIKDAGVRLLDENLVQGTWGNIGVKLDDQFMLATPSGIDYVMLKPEQMAKVNMETLEWTGTNKATSEKVSTRSCSKATKTSPQPFIRIRSTVASSPQWERQCPFPKNIKTFSAKKFLAQRRLFPAQTVLLRTLLRQSVTHPLALWDITALWSEAKTSKTRLRFAELSKTLAAIISQNNRI